MKDFLSDGFTSQGDHKGSPLLCYGDNSEGVSSLGRDVPLRLPWGILFSILLLSSCAPFWSGQPVGTATPNSTLPGGKLSSPTPQNLRDLLQTEQLLLTTPHPVRDLYSLAQRLKLHTA